MHLVKRVHFRSRDKDGDRIIRTAVVENPMLHANFTALCFIERELLPIDVIHCGIGIFHLFGACDLDLDTMTFIYELDPYSWRYTACAKMNFLRPLFQKLSFDRHTDIQLSLIHI